MKNMIIIIKIENNNKNKSNYNNNNNNDILKWEFWVNNKTFHPFCICSTVVFRGLQFSHLHIIPQADLFSSESSLMKDSSYSFE